MALGITEPVENKTTESSNKKSEKSEECTVKKSESNEMIFTLDEETAIDASSSSSSSSKIKPQTAAKQESPGHIIPTNSVQTVILTLTFRQEYLMNLYFCDTGVETERSHDSISKHTRRENNTLFRKSRFYIRQREHMCS